MEQLLTQIMNFLLQKGLIIEYNYSDVLTKRMGEFLRKCLDICRDNFNQKGSDDPTVVADIDTQMFFQASEMFKLYISEPVTFQDSNGGWRFATAWSNEHKPDDTGVLLDSLVDVTIDTAAWMISKFGNPSATKFCGTIMGRKRMQIFPDIQNYGLTPAVIMELDSKFGASAREFMVRFAMDDEDVFRYTFLGTGNDTMTISKFNIEKPAPTEDFTKLADMISPGSIEDYKDYFNKNIKDKIKGDHDPMEVADMEFDKAYKGDIYKIFLELEKFIPNDPKHEKIIWYMHNHVINLKGNKVKSIKKGLYRAK